MGLRGIRPTRAEEASERIGLSRCARGGVFASKARFGRVPLPPGGNGVARATVPVVRVKRQLRGQGDFSESASPRSPRSEIEALPGESVGWALS